MQSKDEHELNNRHEEDGIKFSPPLYQQRYRKVYEILEDAHVTSVVDLGCAECKSLRLFKDLPTLNRLIGVDIDKQLLVDSQYRLRPLITHYLHRRSKTLVVQLLHGNLLQWDNRLRNTDAVTMIEVIEHLIMQDVNKLPEALFGRLRPKLIVMTTPNAEFNVLFPNLVGFRHPDHKFEWTRKEFKDWCDNVCMQYSYNVRYEGIGDAPSGFTHLGGCSQMAVFTRIELAPISSPEDDNEPSCIFEQVCKFEYVGEIPTTIESKILNEAKYYIRFLSRSIAECCNCEAENAQTLNGIELTSSLNQFNGQCPNKGDDCEAAESQIVISLSELMTFNRLQAICGDIEKLREVLTAAGYVLTPDSMSIFVSRDDDCNDFWNDKKNDDDDDDDYYENTAGLQEYYKQSPDVEEDTCASWD